MVTRNNIKVPTFVKWAGGKIQLLGQFRKFLPQKIERYFEPFLGSGAFFFYVKKYHNPQFVSLSDTNKELISSFEVVRDAPNELIKLLKGHRKNHSKEYYYKIRNLEPEKMSKAEVTARFIYLNKTCFNGLYRVNAQGKFNVPIGKYKNPKVFDELTLMKASSLLKGVHLETFSFENIVKHAKAGDFVYFDPPYFPLSKTSSFTSYTKDAFLESEQRKLAEVYGKLDKMGCILMLSNSDSELIRKLYDNYRIELVKASRSINCISSGRGKINELVILNR